ncbi:hypothetical protein RJG79_05565 [Mycoplasmatota bacterium WC44]
MKLNNKGIGLIEVLAAAMIISIVFVSIINNILDMHEMNLKNQRRNTAYNLALEVYHHIGATGTFTFENDITPLNLVAYYDLDNCSIPNGTGSLQKILNEDTCIAMMNQTIDGYEYKNEDVIFYVYTQDQTTMNEIINNPKYNAHPLLKARAQEVIANSNYNSNSIFRISIIVEYGEEDNYAFILNGFLRR